MFRLLLLLPLVCYVSSETVCGGFGYNWAAEIRCLRAMLSQCHGETEIVREPRSHSNQSQSNRNSRHPQHGGEMGRWNSHHVTTTTTTTTASPDPLEDDFCFRTDLVDLQKNLTSEFENRIGRIREILENEIRIAEDRFNHKYLEMKRKNEVEMKRVLKRVKLMTSRVYRFLDKEYIFVDDKESWYGAEEQCVSWGGHLVSVRDHRENEFVRSLLRSSTVWLSINDVQLENAFVNTDGSNSTFRNWMEGQPDNANHNENCIEMNSSGRWSDQFCLITREYVCKR